MANKELHDFPDKNSVSLVEGAKTFELLASKSGQTAINVTFQTLKDWVLRDGASSSDDDSGTDIAETVSELKQSLSNGTLSVAGKTLSADASGWKFSSPAFANSNRLAEFGTDVRFSSVTSNWLYRDGANSTAYKTGFDLLDNTWNLYLPENDSTINRVIKADYGQVSFGNDIVVGNFISANSIRSRSGGVVSIHPAGGSWKFSVENAKASATGGEVSQVAAEAATLAVISADASSSGGESKVQLSVGGVPAGGMYCSSSGYPSLKLKGSAAEILFYRPSVDQSSAPVNDATQGAIKFTAREGVIFDASTDVTINPSRLLNWRYATNQAYGLMSKEMVKRLEDVESLAASIKTDVQGNTVLITNTLGFSQVSDGTNTRAASAADKQLRFGSSGGVSVAVSSSTTDDIGIVDISVGVDNTVVKTSGAQTISDKILESPVVNTPQISGGTVTNSDITAGTGSVHASHIHDKPVSSTAPTSGQILQFDGANWVPVAIPSSGSEPTFSSGSVSQPSIRFTNDADTGLFRDTSGLSTTDGLVIVRDGARKMTIAASEVGIEDNVKVGQSALVGIKNTATALPDVMLRRTTEGLRGNTQQRSVSVVAGSQDVVEFRSDYAGFLRGIRRRVRTVTASQSANADDSVLFVEANSDISLPQAATSAGMELVVACTGNATSVNIRGFVNQSGTPDPVDGLKAGISISANETALLICDGQKWVRLGGIGTGVAGGSGTSTPATQGDALSFSSVMIDFSDASGSVVNGYPFNYFDGLAFKYKNRVTKNQTAVALKNASDNSDSKVVLRNIVNVSGDWSVSTPFEDSRYYLLSAQDLNGMSNASSAYIVIGDVPAGSYTLYAVGFANGYNQHSSRLLVTNNNAEALTASSLKWRDGLSASSAVGTYVGTQQSGYVVLGQTTLTADPAVTANGSIPASGQWSSGQYFAKGNFTVSDKKDIRVYWARASSYGPLGAIYLVRN